jgi:hypothetical protein
MLVFSDRPSVLIGILAECTQSESFPPEPCHMNEISGLHIGHLVMDELFSQIFMTSWTRSENEFSGVCEIVGI